MLLLFLRMLHSLASFLHQAALFPTDFRNSYAVRVSTFVDFAEEFRIAVLFEDKLGMFNVRLSIDSRTLNWATLSPLLFRTIMSWPLVSSVRNV